MHLKSKKVSFYTEQPKCKLYSKDCLDSVEVKILNKNSDTIDKDLLSAMLGYCINNNINTETIIKYNKEKLCMQLESKSLTYNNGHYDLNPEEFDDYVLEEPKSNGRFVWITLLKDGEEIRSYGFDLLLNVSSEYELLNNRVGCMGLRR